MVDAPREIELEIDLISNCTPFLMVVESEMPFEASIQRTSVAEVVKFAKPPLIEHQIQRSVVFFSSRVE
jgi:hypothetical protein